MRRWIVALAVVAAGVAGCGSGAGDEGGGASVFPDSSLEDWVSYADHVATYTVLDEREDGPMADYTIRIDRVLWSAPNAPPLPDRIENRFLNGELDVGAHYFVPFVQVEFTQGPEWWPLQTESALSLDDGGELDSRSEATATAEALDGKSVDEVVDVMTAQRPSALAARYADLRPQDRVQAVMHEESTGTPLRVEHLRPVRDCTLPARRCDDPELNVSATERAWLYFDVSSIPRDATIHEAILWLPQVEDRDRRHQRISLRDSAGRMVNEGQTLGVGTRGDWSIAELVADWVDGSQKNRGVRIRFGTPAMQGVAFSSSEGDRAPELQVLWSR